MSILNDSEIKALCTNQSGMIYPFEERLVREETYKHYSDDDGERSLRKVISYGLSSYGYDIRLANKDIKVFTNVNGSTIDPRNPDEGIYASPKIRTDVCDGAEYVILPPNTGLLGHTLEYFKIPRDVLGKCLGKSTYARCFISVIVTPLEPGWEGNLVIEVVNHSPLPARIYLNQGIAQLVFFKGNPCEVSYADRGGKYQCQVGTRTALV